jgi:glycosyltransferase involved in cell wall biosynthesis
MIPTYNCAGYLKQTLASVLAQDPGPEGMQIEVVDDCSTQDDPFKVVEELAGNRVGVYRQPENVGHVRNFNTCLQRSRGDLIHLLHGDDQVRPGFYETMQRPFLEHPDIGAAFCRDIRIDEKGHWQNLSPLLQSENGILQNWLEIIAAGQRLQAPAMVVRRDVYERLGGFDARIAHYGEDWEMWVRIAAHYPVWYEVAPLALYRIHLGSLSGQTVCTGENGRDLRTVIAINRAYLPESRASELTYQAEKNFALACLRRGHRLLSAGNTQAAFAQMREAVKTNRSLGVLLGSVYLFLRWFWRKMQPAGPKAREEFSQPDA